MPLIEDIDADAVLFQFCREYLDEMKFPGDSLPRRHLPFQIAELLDSYLGRECEKNKMPQMRWAYQIFGNFQGAACFLMVGAASFSGEHPHYKREI